MVSRQLDRINQTLLIISAIIFLYSLLTTLKIIPDDPNQHVYNALSVNKSVYLSIISSGFNFLGSKIVSVLLFLISCCWIYHRSGYDLLKSHVLFFIISIGIFSMIKFGIHSPRPDFLPNDLEIDSSFPSGHASRVLLIFGSCFIYLQSSLNKMQKIKHISIIALLTFLSGFSRLYSERHWLTDILGAVSFSVIALVLYNLYFKTKQALLTQQ